MTSLCGITQLHFLLYIFCTKYMHQYAAGELTHLLQPNGKIEYHEFRNFMILANPSGVLHFMAQTTALSEFDSASALPWADKLQLLFHMQLKPSCIVCFINRA